MLALYTAATFLGAALLFAIEPFAARQALPLFGGSPAVWNACVMFFQVELLAGYVYAHLLTTRAPGRVQLVVHGAVLALAAVVPVGLRVEEFAGEPSVWVLLWLLVKGVGLPFFAVASAGPLLQRWFARTGHRAAGDPYFLYAASNAGSFVGLLAYPFVIERVLSLGEQAAWWRGGFVAFVGLSVAAGVAARGAVTSPERKLGSDAEEPDPSLGSGLLEAAQSARARWRERAWWVLLAFIPSSLLLGVTQYISTDLAAAPLLWVVPLGVYLLTFVAAFSRGGGAVLRIAARAWPFVTVGVVVAFLMNARQPIVPIMTLHLLVLATAGCLCHGRLREGRPAVSRLTEYYLCIAAGGALGGVFNSLVAPVVFTELHEYPLAIGLACLALPTSGALKGAWRAVWLAPVALAAWVWVMGRALPETGAASETVALLLVAGVPAFALFLTSRVRGVFTLATLGAFAGSALAPDRSHVEFQARTFYGVHTVGIDPERGFRVLSHGATVHGIESRDPVLRGEPLAYYSRKGPAGFVFETFGERLGRVAFIGLGAGSLAAYGRPGQAFDFFELDPLVVRIARNPEWFSFISGCRAETRFIVGDGRLTLAREPAGTYDMIVLDAFSSDAVPIHLLTAEAVGMYARKLKGDGLLLFHLSNLHLDLAPFASAACREVGMEAALAHDLREAQEQRESGRFTSTWLVATRDAEVLGALGRDVRWEGAVPGARPWTDSHADLVAALARGL